MKKLLTMLLAAALVVSASFALFVVPTGAEAAAATSVTVDGTTLNASTASTADGKATFADGTLTLDGASVGVITAQGALTIELKGENSATNILLNTEDVENSLTIQGDGSLQMGTEDAFIDNTNGGYVIEVKGRAASLTVTGGATVNINTNVRGIHVASATGEAKATFSGASTVDINTVYGGVTMEALLVLGVPSTTLVTEKATLKFAADTCAFRMGHDGSGHPSANHTFRVDGEATLDFLGRSQPFYIAYNSSEGDTYKVDIAEKSTVTFVSNVGGCPIFCFASKNYEVEINITTEGKVELSNCTRADGVVASANSKEDLIVLNGAKATITIAGADVTATNTTGSRFMDFQANEGTVTIGGHFVATVPSVLINLGKGTIALAEGCVAKGGASAENARDLDAAMLATAKYVEVSVAEEEPSDPGTTSDDTDSNTSDVGDTNIDSSASDTASDSVDSDTNVALYVGIAAAVILVVVIVVVAVVLSKKKKK